MNAQEMVKYAMDAAEGKVTLNYMFRLSRNAVKRLGHDADGYAMPDDDDAKEDVSADVKDAKQSAMDAKLCNTPITACKAKNPMFCPYHGLEAMNQKVGEMLAAKGLSANMGTDYALKKAGKGWWKLSLSCPADQQDEYKKVAEAFLATPGFIKGETAVENPGGQFVKHDEDVFFKVDEKDKAGAKVAGQLENIEASIMDEYLAGNVPDGAMKQILDMMAGMQAVEDDYEHGVIDGDKYAQAMPDLIGMMKGMCDKVLAKKKFGSYTPEQKVSMKHAQLAAVNSFIDCMWKAKKETNSIKKDLGWSKCPNGFPGCQALYSAEKALKSETEKWNDLAKAFDAADEDGKAQVLMQMDDLNKSMQDNYLVYGQCQQAMQHNLLECLHHGFPVGDKTSWKTIGLTWPKHLSENAAKTIDEKKKAQPSVVEVNQDNIFDKNAQKFTDDESGTMPALEHAEDDFPKTLTMAMITSGKNVSGASGNSVYKITVNGKAYAAKVSGYGKEKFLESEMQYDAAYRAAGVLVPDFKRYEVDGHVVKLAKWIDGKNVSLLGHAQRESAKQDLLKGFALDALFSNWDVLGTNLSNVVVDKEGRCWRIDNGGAGRFDAHGHKKSLKDSYMAEFHKHGDMSAPKTVAYEDWDAWENRQWIDDFRTMRRAQINEGMFDYTTAEIFNAAGHIDFGRAVETLPEDAQKALAKPLFEMKQMTMHCVGATMSGIKNMDMLSQALDTMYEASKRNLRELCMHDISWGNSGFGETDTSETVYQKQPFSEKKPVAPVDPTADKTGKELKNEEYTGMTIAKALEEAAKSINYHAGFKAHAMGNKMDTPDYKPPSSHFVTFNKINREKLEELAKSDAQAKHLLDLYDAIVSSREGGFKNPIGWVNVAEIKSSLPAGFKTAEEIAYEKDKAGVIAKYKKDYAKYETALSEWKAKEAEWDKREEEKAIASGKNPFKNFYDYADQLLRKGFDTDGVQHNNGEGIGIIEHGKCANKFGHGYSASTQEDSWTPPSAKLKVLELVFRGMSPSEIKAIPDNDPLINNGIHSSKKARNWFVEGAEFYLNHPHELQRDCSTYAKWKGLQTMKLENESCVVSSHGTPFDLYRHDTHSLALSRGEYYFGTANIVNPVKAKAANASSAFLSNSWGSTHFLYDVPFWNVGYSYNDSNSPNSQWQSYKGTEHEITSTLIGLPPYCASGEFAPCFKKALATPEFQKVTQKRKARLAPFLSSMKQFLGKLHA